MEIKLTFPADDDDGDDKKKKKGNNSSSSSDSDSEDGEDSRDMTGRIYTKAGIEVNFLFFRPTGNYSLHSISESLLVQSVRRVLW